MRICYMTFRSVTPAQKAEHLLRRAGVECSLQRTPRWMEEQGCGYSLRLRHRDISVAADLLKEGGAQYKKIYLYRENGGYEELHL